MPHGISKSRYTQFRSCEKALWMGVFKSEEAVIDAQTEARFAAGNEVGDLAMGLLGPFEEVTVRREDGHLDYGAMIARTQDAMARGVENICEASFSFGGNYCAVDILHRVEGGYEIYEVKSSTEADKEIYAWDVAFQKWVLENCGITVKGTYLVCINNEYVRQGDIDIQQLFKVNDISEAVDREYPDVAANVKAAKDIRDGGEPQIPISVGCNDPYECAFWQYCTRGIPKPSVFNLYRLSRQKKFDLYNAGTVKLDELGGVKLNRIQQMQVDGYMNGTIHIDRQGIQDFLDTLTYPLYHLDCSTSRRPPAGSWSTGSSWLLPGRTRCAPSRRACAGISRRTSVCWLITSSSNAAVSRSWRSSSRTSRPTFWLSGITSGIFLSRSREGATTFPRWVGPSPSRASFRPSSRMTRNWITTPWTISARTDRWR